MSLEVRRAPEPRPDYVIQEGAKTIAILDAKYRDMWEHPLPRDILYQLAMYALSQGLGATATILYPTIDEAAKEARINIADPVYGEKRACVVLRPVNLLRLHELVSVPVGHVHRRARARYARHLVFGETRDS